jgi:hypothetical protein
VQDPIVGLDGALALPAYVVEVLAHAPRRTRPTGEWAAPGFIDTLFRAMMQNEVRYGTQDVQPRVQARGG